MAIEEEPSPHSRSHLSHLSLKPQLMLLLRNCRFKYSGTTLNLRSLEDHPEYLTGEEVSSFLQESGFSFDGVLDGRRCRQPLIYFCEGKYFFLHFEEQKSFGGSYSAYVTLLGEPLECVR